MRTLWIAACSLWMLAVPLSAPGQHVTGCVEDADRDTPLPGAHVTTPKAGTAADSTGCFRLNLPPGTHTLTARMLGYDAQRRSLTLSSDTTVQADFRLHPEPLSLQQLEVVADRASPPEMPPAFRSLSSAEVASLPGASEDVLRTLQATPGVTHTSDFSSQLIVRGSRPDENLIAIDGVEVLNPHRLHGVVSVFNPALLDDATLYAGGFPARYGDRLSAVLDVTTRSGTSDHWLRGSVNASLSNANVVLEGQTGFWDGAWIVAGRRTYYDLLLELFDAQRTSPGRTTFPSFADIQGKLTLHPSATHRIDGGVLAGRDALDMTLRGATHRFTSAADRLHADETSRNDMAYVRWQWRPTPSLTLTTTASGYRNRGTAHSGGKLVPQDRLVGTNILPSQDTTNVFSFNTQRQFRLRKGSLHHRVQWMPSRHAVEAGLEIDRLHTTLSRKLAAEDFGRHYLDVLHHIQPLGSSLRPGAFNRTRTYGRYALYVQDRIALFDDALHVEPGLRLDHYGLLGASQIVPRLRMQLALTPATSLHAAWGQYGQSPGFEKLLMSRQNIELSNTTDLSALQPERATHYMTGLTQRWGQTYSLELAGYLKTMHDLIAPQWKEIRELRARYTGDAPRTDPVGYELYEHPTLEFTSRLTNTGHGRAYGLEVTLRKRKHSADRLSGWIGYTYARSIRSYRLAPAIVVDRPFAYDRRHMLTAAGRLRLGAHWTLNASFRLGTGFPHTTPTGTTPVVATGQDGTAQVLTHSETGTVRFTPTFGSPERLYDARLPPYHRLDLRLTRTVDWSAFNGRFYADVVNVYNRHNVLSYQYAAVTDPERVRPVIYQQALYMLPFLPSIGFDIQF